MLPSNSMNSVCLTEAQNDELTPLQLARSFRASCLQTFQFLQLLGKLGSESALHSFLRAPGGYLCVSNHGEIHTACALILHRVVPDTERGLRAGIRDSDTTVP